jgi:hypothetical protein
MEGRGDGEFPKIPHPGQRGELCQSLGSVLRRRRVQKVQDGDLPGEARTTLRAGGNPERAGLGGAPAAHEEIRAFAWLVERIPLGAH